MRDQLFSHWRLKNDDLFLNARLLIFYEFKYQNGAYVVEPTQGRAERIMQVEVVRECFPASVIEHDLRIRLAAFPFDAHSWYLLGCHLMKEHRLEDARTALETAVDLRPSITVFRMRLALLYEILSLNKRAKQQHEKCN